MGESSKLKAQLELNDSFAVNCSSFYTEKGQNFELLFSAIVRGFVNLAK